MGVVFIGIAFDSIKLGLPEPTSASIKTCCLSEESSIDVVAGAVIPGGGEGVLVDFVTGTSACFTGLEGAAVIGDF